MDKTTFVTESNGAYGYGGHTTLRIDEMRLNEFPQLQKSVHLDHAGATMYAKTQLDAVFQELQRGLFTNPHSATNRSNIEPTTAQIEHVRRLALAFFSASEEEYTLIFTSGATAALKLIGESFPWTEDSTFAYSMDSHTSVLGIREYAAARGSTIQCVGLKELEQLERGITNSRQRSVDAACSQPQSDAASTSLFAFPAECNFSGTRHNFNAIVDQVRAGRWKSSKNKNTRWLVLVDAAKHAATHRLDLSTHHPDFVVLSFYKLFGYPTGLGALVMRKSAMSHLKKPYHGGGTVQSISARRNYFVPRGTADVADMSSRFADGTQSFLSILALRHGFEQIEKLGMASISAHTAALRTLLVGKLTALKHWNARPICKIYGNDSSKSTADEQGPIVACNFLRPDGSYVGYSEVHKLADIHDILLRTGCFCNPGACQHYLGLQDSDLMSNIAAGHVCGDDIDVVNGLPTGAVRLSFGYMTTFEDIAAFIEFVSNYFTCRTAPTAPTPSSMSISLASEPVSKRRYLCKITLFPIKSCSGMSVDAWPIGSRGLLFDREFAIVDVSTGKALTLKALPELCSIVPVVDLERETLTISYRTPDENLMPRQSVVSPSSLTISLRADVPTIQHNNERDSRSMCVCNSKFKGRDEGSDVSQWLSSCLGRPCTLVRVANDHVRTSRSKRTINANATATNQQPEGITTSQVPHPPSIGFANQAQYLLISRQSVAHFNAKLAASNVSMSINEDAFRANLIVDGCAESFEEDQWHRVRIGDGVFDVSGPCSRCNIINLDPHTGQFQRQPLQVLSSYRRQRSSIFFGQYLASTCETVWLHLGDDVEVDAVAAASQKRMLDPLQK
uniref:Molybdenum cofactor sulfurase n=1 Tax=Hyaloperonospora arabidopsidis (strain Emoy2) TaxID=559515 RepID=M4BRK3_HYAAE